MNLLLIMLYSYTERDRGCSTELYFCIAWKKPWPLLIRGVITQLSCSKKAELSWWNSRVLVHLYAWNSLFLEQLNHQIINHISLGTGLKVQHQVFQYACALMCAFLGLWITTWIPRTSLIRLTHVQCSCRAVSSSLQDHYKPASEANDLCQRITLH